MIKLSQIWFETQGVLFPFLEKEIEEKIRTPKYWHGQFPRNRHQIARAFIAKAIYNMDTTRALIDRLEISPALRRICGWEKVCDIPHESSFSRAFKEFSESGLSQIVHKSLIEQHMSNKIIGHISRDSTSIDAREKPVKKNIKISKQKRKRGRPCKGEIRTKELTRLERQQSMGTEEMLKELPGVCNVGTKKDSKGYKKSWIGYKLHIDAGDGHIPTCDPCGYKLCFDFSFGT